MYLNGEHYEGKEVSLRELFGGKCLSVQMNEGDKEFCPDCSWKGCPDNPEYNYHMRPYWEHLTFFEKMFLRSVFQKGWSPGNIH